MFSFYMNTYILNNAYVKILLYSFCVKNAPFTSTSKVNVAYSKFNVSKIHAESKYCNSMTYYIQKRFDIGIFLKFH